MPSQAHKPATGALSDNRAQTGVIQIGATHMSIKGSGELKQRLKKFTEFFRNIPWIAYFLGGIALGTALGIYLWILYLQVNVAFNQQDQFIPTRIYSDVARIQPGELRSQIESRLTSRGYAFTRNGDTLQFTLRAIDYPAYLIPENHPQLQDKTPNILMSFDKSTGQSVLQTIQVENQPRGDFYLEPEIVATLSQGKAGETKREIRTPLKFEEVPASVWKAIIAIEDQHFLDHNGLDPRGIARAMWVNIKTFSLAQGGSTITQQLVKNLMERHTKNIFKKVNELFLSLILESRFEKEKILERYLNEVYLGQVGSLEVHGVAEGAEHFFGKSIQELNLAEITLMAGLIRGPGFYSPYKYPARAKERQQLVLKKMVETEQIAASEAEAAKKYPIRLIPPQTATTKAPFFTDYVKAELIRTLKKGNSEEEVSQAGYRVYTTLDTYLNAMAQEAVAENSAALEKRFNFPPRQRLEGALACADQATGFIRVLVGGRSYSQSTFNRILNMKRQVGSTFKPVVYLSAILKGEDANGVPYGPGYPVEDAPWSLKYDRGTQTWSPNNYEKKHRGWVQLRTAFANSINIVAARLGNEIGLDHVVQTARLLGITSDLPAVPSLTLGVAEMSPIELLKMYTTIAQHGTQNELTVIRGITERDGKGYARFMPQPKHVFEPGPADLVSNLLESVFTEGTARSAAQMGLDRPAAGKTGTTSNHRDAWFAGYTPQLTTVVWVGMDQVIPNTVPELPFNPTLTGTNSALPLWVNFMRKAHRGFPATAFAPSGYLVDLPVDRHTGNSAQSGCPPEQVVTEKFVLGHEPRTQSCEPNWPKSEPAKK